MLLQSLSTFFVVDEKLFRKRCNDILHNIYVVYRCTMFTSDKEVVRYRLGTGSSDQFLQSSHRESLLYYEYALRQVGWYVLQLQAKTCNFFTFPPLYFESSTGKNWAAVHTLNTLPYPRYSRGNSVDYQIPRLPGKLFHRLPCRTDIPYPPTNFNSIFHSISVSLFFVQLKNYDKNLW